MMLYNTRSLHAHAWIQSREQSRVHSEALPTEHHRNTITALRAVCRWTVLLVISIASASEMTGASTSLGDEKLLAVINGKAEDKATDTFLASLRVPRIISMPWRIA